MFRSKINRVYILSFLFSIHVAITSYANSTFLSEIIKEQYVGLLYTIASVIALFFLSKSARFLSKFGNKNFTLTLMYLNMMALFGLAYFQNSILIASSFIVFFITNALVFYCIDIFVEHFEKEGKIGQTRGIYLTIVNLAWMVSPIIAGYLISTEGGFRNIYIFSFYFAIFSAVLFLYSIQKYKDKKYTRTPFFETYRFLKTNRHLFAVSMINFLLQFFYVLMVIYTPLYLIEHLKIGWDKIGIIFTIMLIPFVLLSFPVGILIDKYNVKKRSLLATGIIIAGVSTFLIPGISSNQIYIWAGILFLTRVGATLIESTSEIYFFTHSREEDAPLLSAFRDMAPLAYVVAPLFGTAFLMFFPLKNLFFAIGIIMLCGLFYIPRLKHSQMPNHLYKKIN